MGAEHGAEGAPNHRLFIANAAASGATASRIPLGAGALDYAKARAIIAHYEARLAKIDYEERIKKLINADEVSVAAFNLFRMFRDRMLNIPDRVVGALVAELREAIIAIGVDPEIVKGLDLGKVHGILTAEIRSALEEFADAAHR